MNKDLNSLKQKYAELGEELKQLEAALKPWPQEGDEVFILHVNGDIYKYIYADSVKPLVGQGHGFRTRAEAEAEWHYRDVAYKLSQQEGARKFVNKEPNYCLIYELPFSGKPDIQPRYGVPEGQLSVYFDKREQVNDAIAAVGEQEIIRAIRWKELGETS